MAAGATTGKGNAPTSDDLLAQISEQAGEIAQLKDMLADSYGIDVELAKKRANTKRIPVQFKEHFARAAKPSKLQKGRNEVEQYFAQKGRIYLLREDEAERLKAERVIRHVPANNGKTKIEFREIIETDPKKFKGMTVHEAVLQTDNRGRNYWGRREVTIEVETLLKNAEAIG